MSDAPVLRKHRLKHLPELKVAENVFRIRYKDGCSMYRCSGYCCRDGVVAELAERDKILEHADYVKSLMDPEQQHDTAKWFDEEFEDGDSPMGRSTGTQVHNGNCVFLNKKKRCVLQMAEPKTGALKPFYCYAFPICVTEGALVIDDDHCPNESNCCGPVAQGELTILDLCSGELEYVLGADGLAELRVLFDKARPKK